MTAPSLPHVLLVDDDPAIAKVLAGLLEQDDIASTWVSSGDEALARLGKRSFHVVLSDLRMPGMDGLELLARIRAEHPGVPVILLTAHGTVPLAVEAMKAGAAEFVLKPFERDELLFVVRKELARVRSESEGEPVWGGIIGGSTSLATALDRLGRAARGDATVLIRGESGTGKEQFARLLHERGARASGPLVTLHCAGLPDTLLESELFGYEKGAFTGAVGRKPGRVELAQGGTLFLDEVGDTTPAMQVKLLRLLQERQYERLGGTQTLRADVRFVAATHRPLEELVAAGQFREDLFYRLNVVPIWLPPLRERLEDIPALARHFCETLGKTHGHPGLQLDDAAVARLARERWPGNVRQLQNFVERLVVLASGSRVMLEDVERELGRQPFRPREEPADEGLGLEERRRRSEREALVEALEKAHGNRTLAARLLGVSRRTLYNKLEELGVE